MICYDNCDVGLLVWNVLVFSLWLVYEVVCYCFGLLVSVFYIFIDMVGDVLYLFDVLDIF